MAPPLLVGEGGIRNLGCHHQVIKLPESKSLVFDMMGILQVVFNLVIIKQPGLS